MALNLVSRNFENGIPSTLTLKRLSKSQTKVLLRFYNENFEEIHQSDLRMEHLPFETTQLAVT